MLNILNYLQPSMSSSDNEDDHLLNTTIYVPSTQMPSPTSFSTQIVNRLRIKSYSKRRTDAAGLNTNMRTYIYIVILLLS